MPELRLWQNLWVRLAVALAFADASIVVLALPEIVERLHTSISHVVWVIVAYNLALIVGCGLILLFARSLRSRWALVGGLAVFGLASIGCGASGSLGALIPLRCVQGLGGALILCASLPLFAGASGPGDAALYGWSAAAAIGAAVGPAAGGVLTQLFSWRAIFYAQAPVAAVAAVAVLAVQARPGEIADSPASPDAPPGGELGASSGGELGASSGGELGASSGRASVVREGRRTLDPLTANAGLALLSAGLIGALFLVVLELINVWEVSPIGAAAIVTTIPVATAIAERAVRGRSPVLLGALGAILLGAGLLVLSVISHRELGWVVVALALCGAGLGLGFPGLTSAALRSRGSAVARAARTVAARDAGLILGLLVLTPVFVHELNGISGPAERNAAGKVIVADIPIAMKLELAPKLLKAVNSAPQSRLPDIAPAFAQVGSGVTGSLKVHLDGLQQQLESIIQRAATNAFKQPLQYAALFALAVLPLLGLRVLFVRLRD